MANGKRKQKSSKAVAATDKALTRVAALVPGPSKERAKGATAPRVSHHKKRSAWFRARASWPLREASSAKLARERRKAVRMLAKVPATSQWKLAGPTNIGGRCTTIVCDPGNADRIWIGAAGGGVWASKDGGKTWKPRWRAGAPLQIGALAIDPSAPGTLYCGTGEANLSADSYPGDGIYRSANGGVSWKPWALTAATGVPRRIGVIAVDPFDSKHILVGGIGFGRQSTDNDFGGLYSTADAGATWSRATFVSPNNYWCHSIVFDPKTPGTLLATFSGPGAASGIYRSKNGGSTWTQLTAGLPPPERMGRTTLALAPSNPKIVYANVSDVGSNTADRVLGVFRSADGGTSWVNIAGHHFDQEGQMSYGNAIAVHPTNPDQVICGGVDLHATVNAGAMWRVASHWDSERTASDYAHADHHLLLMPASAPGRVYTANDGGLSVSNDGGLTWEYRGDGLVVTMYYDMDIAQTDARVFGGGAQDNGTLVTNNGNAHDFFELLGGDGGWVAIDPRDAGHIFASFQYGGMYRFRNGGHRKVTPPFRDEDMGGVWMVYITFDPNNSDVVYTGNQRVYCSRNDGVSWNALTPSLDGSPISAIEVAAADSKCIYVATENGGFFRSLDGGTSWSANLANSTLPSVMITRIASHPADARDLCITVGNFGNSHVFRSRDAGSSWADIDRGQLPDVPHHALLIRPDSPGTMYVCNDAGVYLTRDGGASWLDSTLKLPNVMVVDLVYQKNTKTLCVATYGRGLWQLQLS